MKRLVALLVAAATTSARADDATVTVTLTPQGQALAQDLGTSEAELIQRVQDKVTALYQLANLASLLTAVGNASSSANRGLGVDYATRAGEIVFGVVGVGAAAGGPEFGNSKVSSGDIINLGLFAGASLTRWGLPELAVFANGYYETQTVDQLTGHLLTLGVHVQWRALPSRGRWIGLDVTSGLEYSREQVGAEQPVSTHFTVQGDTPGESRNLALTSTGTLTLAARTITVPVTVTTGMRLGALEVYTGGSLDFTSGSTTITAGLDGQLATTDDQTPVGTLVISATGGVSASPVILRALAGLQLDFWHLHIYAQGDLSQVASGVSFGVRVRL